MEYFNTFDFWVYLVWVSSAVGFGLATGLALFVGACALIDRLLDLKFKKDEEEEK